MYIQLVDVHVYNNIFNKAFNIIMWYIVLIQETAREIVTVMWTCLETDNQLSLRYSMEWLVVLLYHKYPILCEETLLPQMKMVTLHCVFSIIVFILLSVIIGLWW